MAASCRHGLLLSQVHQALQSSHEAPALQSARQHHVVRSRLRNVAAGAAVRAGQQPRPQLAAEADERLWHGRLMAWRRAYKAQQQLFAASAEQGAGLCRLRCQEALRTFCVACLTYSCLLCQVESAARVPGSCWGRLWSQLPNGEGVAGGVSAACMYTLRSAVKSVSHTMLCMAAGAQGRQSAGGVPEGPAQPGGVRAAQPRRLQRRRLAQRRL